MNRKTVEAIATLVAALLLASCERATAPAESNIRTEPVIVFASYDDDSILPKVFAAFTRASGIRVIVQNSATSVDDVIADHGSPPADVLLSGDVEGVWRAAEKGALRPLPQTPAVTQVPGNLRDPDGFWSAINVRTSLLVYRADLGDFQPPKNYQELAQPRYREQLCVSSSSFVTNRTVIAMLIDSLGVRPAEIVVRGWMQNLAAPMFELEADLLAAVESGDCPMAIVSSDNVGRPQGNFASDIRVATFAQLYANVEGVGIARHARNPDGAAALVDWLLSKSAQDDLAAKTYSYSVLDSVALQNLSAVNVSAAGWKNIDAIKLAARSGFR